ncbi:hypothetical protein K503DRAFT_688709, partial [Rhizopogon vinicolor AM-OR11-026]
KLPESQGALRKALQTIHVDSPTLGDEVGKLQYLDLVVREMLRLHVSVTWTMRVATKDDEISAGNPCLDQNGEYSNSIKIRTHGIITIPILAINKKDILGEYSYSFRHVPSCNILCSLAAH